MLSSGKCKTNSDAKMNCNVKNVALDGSRCIYTVKEALIWKEQSANKIYEVIFHQLTKHIECSSRLFELRDILCQHCLIVLAQKDVKYISGKYILSRWSKHIRRRHTLI